MPSSYEIVEELLTEVSVDSEDLEPGEDVSPFPEIALFFTGFDYDEQYIDEDDEEDIPLEDRRDVEKYTLYIHKNSSQEDFVFPVLEDGSEPSDDEARDLQKIYLIHDLHDDSWHQNWDESDDVSYTADQMDGVLTDLHERYF
jgi:hypothetical protein